MYSDFCKGIPDLDAENARLAVEIQEIAKEMTDLQKSLKENSSFDNVVADRMEKIEEMEVNFVCFS